jgi:hypothetical protein
MEKKIGMVGMGRIQNGVMVFTDATGKGFATKLNKPVVRHEPAIKNEVHTVEEALDVPDFMKNRKKEIAAPAKVYQFPTKGGDAWKSIPEKLVDLEITAIKSIAKPFIKYFF